LGRLLEGAEEVVDDPGPLVDHAGAEASHEPLGIEVGQVEGGEFGDERSAEGFDVRVAGVDEIDNFATVG
jgi:hypothetical protein